MVDLLRSQWGEPYRWLIDNPAVEPLLAEMLSDPACVPSHCPESIAPALRSQWRLDHDNIHYKMPHDGATPDEGGTLHGVPEGFHVTAVYELCDVNVGDGGFGCIPGTHDFEFNGRVQAMGTGWNRRDLIRDLTVSKTRFKHDGVFYSERCICV